MARILIKAVQNGQETLAREIILKYGSSGGIDNQTSSRDGTALFFCSSRGYLELAKLLLEKGASVTSTDKNRATPLHGAVDNGHLDVVKLLISHGANVNAQTYRGDTPLHLAAYRGFGEISRCLMVSGADSRLLNCNSFTAENEARARGHHNLCDYIRAANTEHHLGERMQHLDSMIQLDPPSLASCTSLQTTEKRELTKLRHKDTVSFHDNGQDVHRSQQRSCAPLRSKSCDCSNVSDVDTSSPAMEPPLNSLPAVWSSGDRMKVVERPSAGTEPPTMIFHETHVTLRSNSQTTNRNSTSIENASVSSSASPGSNTAWTFPIVSDSRPVSDCAQLLHPSTPSSNIDSHRRPSTGSAGSCLSDFSVGTGSGNDTGSSPSIGSDGSGYYSDSRREDMEMAEPQFGGSCAGEHSQDTDLVLMSLGVKNPPGHNHKRQLSITSESSEFADIYDSSLFSLNSMVSVSRSSSINEYSQASFDVTVSGLGTSCSRLTSLELNNDLRPRLHRATSVNCTFPSPRTALKVRPDYNKSLSTEYRPATAAPGQRTVLCPRFNRMTSNDLSSPLPQTNQSTRSMTCVNIPLN